MLSSSHDHHTDSAEAVREWAELAKEWYKHELGADSIQVRDMGTTIKHPWKHSAWGTRKADKVGGPDAEAVPLV